DWRRLYQREAFDNDLSSDGHRIDAEPALDVDFKIAAFDAKAPGNIGAAWKSDTHAVVPDKIVWRLRFSPLLEISWRPGDDERQFVRDAHRNHVAFNPLAESNAGIEALGHDVAQRVANGQIEGNLVILRQKARNGRGQKKIGRWRRCSEAQCTGRLAAELI